MKKGIVGVLVAVACLSVGGIYVTASERNFVDENQNGECDHYEVHHTQKSNYVDNNNDGICDN